MSTAITTKKILVVDDDPTVVKLLEGILSGQGFAVIVANDGIDAMVQVKNNMPDLIILHIMMPEINGYDVCRNLKFDEKYKNIPIVIFTARNQELDPRIAQMMGIDYMSKPLNREVLLEKVQSALK